MPAASTEVAVAEWRRRDYRPAWPEGETVPSWPGTAVSLGAQTRRATRARRPHPSWF